MVEMMNQLTEDIQRVSPVILKSTPLIIEKRDDWEVVMNYFKEGDGPWLIDLSHRPRFDLQDSNLSGLKAPFGIKLPETPGTSVLENGFLANRMNQTQVSLYYLMGQEPPALPDNMPGITEVTDATLCIALIGPDIFSICEKLTALDFMDKLRTPPFLFQGPFSHVPCQIVTLKKEGEHPGIVLTCSRGYGRDMIHAVLDAGKEFNLAPAGETRFTDWIGTV